MQTLLDSINEAVTEEVRAQLELIETLRDAHGEAGLPIFMFTVSGMVHDLAFDPEADEEVIDEILGAVLALKVLSISARVKAGDGTTQH